MEFSDRQTTAFKAVITNPGCTATYVAESIAPGSDTRGAAQTLRSLTSKGLLVLDPLDHTYHPTAIGRAEFAKMAR